MTERRITIESSKAETALLRLDRAHKKAVWAIDTRYATRKRELINTFADDVLRVLLAARLIEEPDINPGRLPLEEKTVEHAHAIFDWFKAQGEDLNDQHGCTAAQEGSHV